MIDLRRTRDGLSANGSPKPRLKIDEQNNTRGKYEKAERPSADIVEYPVQAALPALPDPCPAFGHLFGTLRSFRLPHPANMPTPESVFRRSILQHEACPLRIELAPECFHQSIAISVPEELHLIDVFTHTAIANG